MLNDYALVYWISYTLFILMFWNYIEVSYLYLPAILYICSTVA